MEIGWRYQAGYDGFRARRLFEVHGVGNLDNPRCVRSAALVIDASKFKAVNNRDEYF
jgi:hypothetical protein